jgi:co-chaperonin GroES (HSP10)
MTLKPIKKNIIVTIIEKEKVTSSGIILKHADAEEVSKGTVTAIGPEVTLIEEGQTILPNWNKAVKTKFDDQEYFIVNEDDIVLIFED